MRALADQHPVLFATLLSAVLFFVFALVILQAVVPRLEGGGRLGGGAAVRTAVVGAFAFAVLTFVLQRLVYST
jgi:hypothetical protein